MKLALHIIVTIVLGYIAVFYASPIMCALCGIWLLMIPIGVWMCRNTKEDLNIFFETRSYVSEVGKPCTLSLKIENWSDRPVGHIRLKLQYLHHFEKKIYKIPMSAKVEGNEKLYLDVQITSDQVGLVECSLTEWKIWDPLGITSAKEKGQSKATIVFLPEVYPVQLLLPENHMGEEGEGEDHNQSRGGENKSEVFQIREYRPGDRLTSIHWKLSARAEELMTREFSHYAQSKGALIFDMSGLDLTNLNETVALGMSIAFALLENGAKFYIAWYQEDKKQMERMLIEQEEQVYEALSCLFQVPLYASEEAIYDIYKRFFPEDHVQIGVNRKLELMYNGQISHRFEKQNLALQIKEIEF